MNPTMRVAYEVTHDVTIRHDDTGWYVVKVLAVDVDADEYTVDIAGDAVPVVDTRRIVVSLDSLSIYDASGTTIYDEDTRVEIMACLAALATV